MKNKLVFESLNEVISFERYKDPLSSLSIGKTQLIKNWLDKMRITNYIINDNFTIDVDDDVDISREIHDNLPEYIQFNIIYGYFDIANNNLTTLKGCPINVQKSFWCNTNNLTTLKYCPKIVLSNFNCSLNPLISLKYCPRKVNDFWCQHTNIKTLEGCPKIVMGDFTCRNNKIKFKKSDVLKYCNVKEGIYV